MSAVVAGCLLLTACNRPSYVDLSEPAPFPTTVPVAEPLTPNALAAAYGIATADLLRLNPGLDPMLPATPGTILDLPRPRAHTVVDGDTIWRLARYYGTTAEVLAALNNLYPPYRIVPGTRVHLPLRAGDRPVLAQAPIDPPLPPRIERPDGFGPPPGRSAPERTGVTVAAVPAPSLPPREAVVAPPPPAFSGLRAPRRPTTDPSPVATPPAAAAGPRVPPPRIPPRMAAPMAGETPAPPPRPPVEGRFIRPVTGPVVSAFGPKPDGLRNDGVNIAAPEGTPITAAAAGEVIYAGNQLRGFGNLVLIRHAGGWVTAYAHAAELWVETGARVAQGQRIGAVGQTGSVDAPQLHFQIRQDAIPVDPQRYLPAA